MAAVGNTEYVVYGSESGRTLCLLVNFQKPKVEWKRIVHGDPMISRLEALQLDDSSPDSNRDSLSAIARSKLLHNMLEMDLHRFFRDKE